MWAKRKHSGFTIVELLIVIVVIAILAAITIVAYNGIQQRARDSQRQSDVKTIVKALELYYVDNGQYPSSGCAIACSVNTSWSTTRDVGWDSLVSQLVPTYISSLPRDPLNINGSVLSGGTPIGYSYAYYAGAYCGAGTRQMYLLAYKVESSAQQNTLLGDCATNPLGPYAPASNYRVVR